MTHEFALAGALAIAIAGMHPPALAPPDFSGTWVLQDGGRPTCRKSFALKQDADALRLDFLSAAVTPDAPDPATPSRRTVKYHFNGTDTRESFPAAPPRPADAKPGAWIATMVASVARAAWHGDRLVVVTHNTMSITWPSRMPDAFERQNTVRDAYSLDANGHLVVNRTAIIDPLPGGTPARMDLPTSWTCTYRKTR